MSTESPAEINLQDELRYELDRLEKLLPPRRQSSGNATINVHAGGVGMWISTTCCAVMFALGIAMAVIGGIAYTSTQQRLDRMQDYINAIYMMAPNLKPKEQKP
jgi:hypothetical protein